MRNKIFFLLSVLAPVFRIFSRKNLRVLAYHNIIDQDVFERQLNYLTQDFSIINIETLKGHVFYGQPLPDYPLLITFDDGDVTVLKPGSDVLVKLHIPACLFIISDLINSKINYWTDTVRINERDSGKDLSSTKNLIRDLKKLPNEERILRMMDYEATEKLQLTSTELVRLSQNKVWIGNHSHTHPMFDKCTKEEIKRELLMFKNSIDKWGVGDYEVFAYPNGNYNESSEETLKENGIKLAFLFDHKINPVEIDPFKISRIRVDSDTPLDEFRVKVSGLHSLLIYLKGILF